MSKRIRWLIAIALLLASGPAGAGASNTKNLMTLVAKSDPATTVTQLLDPRHPVWTSASVQRLQLNRTPPLYRGDPMDDNSRPTTTLQLARIADGTVALRVHWTDPTEDRTGKGPRYSDAGAGHIYHRHTERTDAFSDAFCVMVPVARGPSNRFPTMMMGETAQPVELYYWRAGAGFQVFSGHGRATTGPPAQPAPTPQGRATREGDGWTLTLALPRMTPGTPLCCAIWDGSKAQRDGLKYYSLWYEVE